MSTNVTRTAVSQLLHDKANEDEEPIKQSREDWRKAKELEEARKAGTAPAAVDEEGRDINPHIPQYISTVPWYYGSTGPTLKHQRPQTEEERREILNPANLRKGIDTGKLYTKFRKGACENCGAITHKKKDCLERPRKVGAKFKEDVIAQDEFILPKSGTDYDEKRDRWSSYDPANHQDIIDEFDKVEEAKRQLKAEKLKDNPDAEISDEEETNEDKYVDEVDMPGTKVDSKQRITVRNLRIREDTAKYLRNLDPNSAYYDPKTRSMRDNPNPQVKPEDAEFAGENFVRFTGDTTKHTTAQLFAWDAHEKGVDVHLLAEPTKLELLQQEYVKKKEEFKSQTKGQILEKYGGEEHLQAPPKSLLLAQTEEYVEYSRSGKVIKGMEKQKARSIYEEDVYINNHTSVWGSYWNGGRWGYHCCHSFIKNSYCVGNKTDNDDESVANSIQDQPPNSRLMIASCTQSNVDNNDSNSDDQQPEPEQKKKSKKSKSKKKKKSKDRFMKALKEDLAQDKTDEPDQLDDRKRSYNSMYEAKEPTEEELEEFMRKRKRDEDPMSQFM